MAENLNYDSFITEVKQLFEQGHLADAWELLVTEQYRFDKYQPEIDFIRMCLTSRMGKPELALHILEGSLEDGIWYSPELMDKTPDLAALKENPRYADLLARSVELNARDWEDRSEMIIQEPNIRADYLPLMLILHDDESTAEADSTYWSGIGCAKYLLAFPQSSAGLMTGSYHWWEYDVAKDEVGQAMEQANQAYWIDKENIIIAGAGKGADIAIELALTGDIEGKAFIALEPTLGKKAVKRWLDLLEMPDLHPSRGVILTTRYDESGHKKSLKELKKGFEEAGIEYLRMKVKEDSPGISKELLKHLPAACAFAQGRD